MNYGNFKSYAFFVDNKTKLIFGTGSIPINIKTAQLVTFADGTTKQQGYQVAEVNKLISTMLTGWNANGNKPKSMSDNYLELILSCDNGFVVKKRLQFPHIIAWKDDSTPYNIADVYKEFSIDNWLKADDFENPDITLVVEPVDEILTTSKATPPEATTTNAGRFYLYYRNLPVGVNRVHIDFHIKTKTEPIDFDLEVIDGLSWKDAQIILASNEQAKINVLLSGVKDVYKFTGAEGNFEEITMHEWGELYQQIISLNPNNKFTHDLYFYVYDESGTSTDLGLKILEIPESEHDLDIADENGNVIAEFREGHFITKNFDSRKISEIHESEHDLDIADENGNVLVEFSNGHIKTKEFDSSNIIASSGGIESSIKGKRISILGDSISTFGTPDQNNASGLWTYKGNRCRYPQTNLLTDVNETWWKMLIDNTDAVLGINESWAGSRVSNNQSTDSGDYGPNRCISSKTRILHLGEKGTPDVILVYAGTNDIGGDVEIGTFNSENPINYTEEEIDSLSVSTFADAYRTMLIRLIYYYPKSKIVVLLPNFTTSYYTITELDSYIEIIREACDFFGIEYIDLRTAGITIYNKNLYLPDGIHPNYEGMKLIANRVLERLSRMVVSASGDDLSLLGKKISILGDSISTCVENNAVEFTVLSSDVGKTLQGYPTYYDIGTTIGGKEVTSAMVGTLTSFNPTSDDVGKVIGTPLNYNDLPQSQLWWGILAKKIGVEILQNVSWSGASMSSHEVLQEKYKTSNAWHDAQINKLSRRDLNGNVIEPDIIIIYRGTNDMTHSPYTKISSFGAGSTSIPVNDVLSDGGYGFKEAYCLTIKKIRERYPKAIIICCTLNVFKRINYSEFPTNNGVNTLPEYNNAIREVANYMGCGLIEFDKDGITFENCYPTYISDSATIPTHPNAVGHEKMAEKAYKDIIKI